MSLRDIVGQRMIAARLMDALNAMNIKYRILEDTEATLITVRYNQLRAEFDKSDLKKEGNFSEFLDALLNSRLNTEIYRYLIKENDGWTFEIPRWA
jgi:ribosomal protein S4